MTELNYPNG